MSDVDIGEMILLVIVFVVSISWFLYAALKED